MSAIGSLSTALTTVRKNPILLAGGLLFALFSESYVFLEVYGGMLAQLFVWPILIFAMPFFLAGFIAMVHEATDGSTSLESFVHGGKENYVSMLGATVLFMVIIFGLSFAAMFLLVFAGIGALAAGGGGGGLAIMLVGIVIAVLIIGVVMFLQFYHTAIVISGAKAVDSFSKSVSLVRQNLVSVIGFSLIFFVIGLLWQGPGMALYMMSIEVTETGETLIASESTMYLSVAVSLVLGSIGMAYAYAYLVSYYRSLVENDPTDVAVAAD